MTEEIYDTSPLNYSMKTYGHRSGFVPFDTVESF